MGGCAGFGWGGVGGAGLWGGCRLTGAAGRLGRGRRRATSIITGGGVTVVATVTILGTVTVWVMGACAVAPVVVVTVCTWRTCAVWLPPALTPSRRPTAKDASDPDTAIANRVGLMPIVTPPVALSRHPDNRRFTRR